MGVSRYAVHSSSIVLRGAGGTGTAAGRRLRSAGPRAGSAAGLGYTAAEIRVAYDLSWTGPANAGSGPGMSLLMYHLQPLDGHVCVELSGC